MEIPHNENSRQDTTPDTEAPQPRPWRAAGWLCIYTLLHFARGVFLCHRLQRLPGGATGTQGQAVDPVVIQPQIQAHI